MQCVVRPHRERSAAAARRSFLFNAENSYPDEHLSETAHMAIDIKALDHTQLGDLIKQAEARQGELARRKLQKLRDKISALVRAEGLDFNDVVGARKSTSGGTRSKVKPKYRN